MIDPNIKVPQEQRETVVWGLPSHVRSVIKRAYGHSPRRPLKVETDKQAAAIEEAIELGIVQRIGEDQETNKHGVGRPQPRKEPLPVVLTNRGFSLAIWLRFAGWPKRREDQPAVVASARASSRAV